MKTIRIGTAALIAIAMTATPVLAADMRVKAPVSAPIAPFSWTGCYVGIEGGGNWGRSQHINAVSIPDISAGVPIADHFDLSGGMFGGTVGCNYQVNNWVFGIEDDLSWTNKKGSGFDIPPFNTLTTSETSEKWIDTLRGRIGIAWDRLLVYGTGGVAFARTDVNICAPEVCVSDSQTRSGWVAGAGLEYALWQNVSLKAEYLHADFGNHWYINPAAVVSGELFVTRDVPLTDDMFRVGLNWRFY